MTCPCWQRPVYLSCQWAHWWAEPGVAGEAARETRSSGTGILRKGRFPSMGKRAGTRLEAEVHGIRPQSGVVCIQRNRIQFFLIVKERNNQLVRRSAAGKPKWKGWDSNKGLDLDQRVFELIHLSSFPQAIFGITPKLATRYLFDNRIPSHWEYHIPDITYTNCFIMKEKMKLASKKSQKYSEQTELICENA